MIRPPLQPLHDVLIGRDAKPLHVALSNAQVFELALKALIGRLARARPRGLFLLVPGLLPLPRRPLPSGELVALGAKVDRDPPAGRDRQGARRACGRLILASKASASRLRSSLMAVSSRARIPSCSSVPTAPARSTDPAQSGASPAPPPRP
jgi:hypothetical protein